MDNFSFRLGLFFRYIVVLVIPFLCLISNNDISSAIPIFVVAALLYGIYLYTFPKPRDHRKSFKASKRKQYDENRYSNMYMKKIYEAYNIKENPLAEPNEEDLSEEEVDSQEEKTFPTYEPNYESINFSYENEDDELQKKFFKNISAILGSAGAIWIFVIVALTEEINAIKIFIESATIASLLVKITPALLIIIASITSLLGEDSKSESSRIFIFLRQGLWIVLFTVYIFNVVSKFIASTN